ncbi:MAG: hypothetical protein ACKOE4_04645 [Candidatus Kapaibacterium sp.]
MPFASSQGATVSFAGVPLGSLTNVKAAQSVSGKFDCTSIFSKIIGAGANTRVLNQINPTAVDPGAVNIQFIGQTIFSRADIGRVGQLAFALPSGGALVGLAYLADLEVEAAVGEKLRGSATFQFTGFFS